jgi:hypothetical protein
MFLMADISVLLTGQAPVVHQSFLFRASARNGNLEAMVYFLKAEQGYTARKM